MLHLSVAKDFTKTPGFRYKHQSPGTSGEEFRDKLLEPKYHQAVKENVKLEVNLDGTNGYLTSFVEEAFGGLQRKDRGRNILDNIVVIANEEKHWVQDIKRYVDEARASAK